MTTKTEIHLPDNALRSRSLIASFTSAAIIFLLISGCASTAPKPVQKAETAQKASLVWPSPPEQARIRYLGQIHLLPTEKEKKQMGLKDVLLGKEEQQEQTTSLVKPYAVHSDSKGRVFITDSVISGLIVYDLEKQTTSFWGRTGLGALAKPMGITSDKNGNVYVSDSTGRQVKVFDSNGNYLRYFGSKEVLAKPVGLAFNESTQRLYTVDTANHRIVVFDKDGNVEFTIGERGSQPGNFNYPTNIAIDDAGRLYVADSMNFRIQILEPDGTVVRTIGKIGNAPGDINRLKGIGLDTDGNIYAVDASFANFQIFNTEGELLLAVGKGGETPGRFSLPAGAHVDKNNKIFIVDQYNQRVQMFEYIDTSSDA